MNRPSKIAACVAALSIATAACTIGASGHSASLPPRKANTESNITRLTSQILERSQFSHHPLDAQLATRFLDDYLDALDGSRSLFLSGDVASFAPYRATLARRTRETGDTSAARAIYARYLQRLQQRTQYMKQLLRSEHFDFTGHDRYSFDRKHAGRPSDSKAAEVLWREQLRADYLEEKLNDESPDKIVNTLSRRYDRQLEMMKGLDSSELLDLYLNALAHVYDPHSDYLGHEQLESLASEMDLSLVGIGASLQSVDGYAKIRELLPGGPAAASGLLKPGDRIVAVAQAGKEPVDITTMPLSRAVDLIRGPKGTQVTLSVLAEGNPDGVVPKNITLVRDEVKLEDAQASATLVEVPDGEGRMTRLGVLNVPSFYANMSDEATHEPRSVTRDVERLLAKLKSERVKGVILDLRGNGGGSLNEAISLTGLFIHRGPVVQTRGPDGDLQVDEDPDPSEQYDGPLIVLTNRLSASASEILTGALKDYGRAVVVGDSSTFGKGTVQTVLPLARVMDSNGLTHRFDPGALKVTIRKFYRPDGASTQLRGVASDVTLPSTTDLSDVSESSLEDPLPWDAVAPARHERLNLVAPYVKTLRELSNARVAKSPSFAALRAQLARVQENLARKSISLNEAERRAELAQAKAQQSALDSAEQAIEATQPKSYRITLENATLPGLPAPQLKNAPVKTSSTHATRPGDREAHGDALLAETEQILIDYTKLLHP